MKKKPYLVLLPAVLMAILLWSVVVPWVATRGKALGVSWGVLSGITGAIWMLVLWWAMHHLVFQIATLFDTTTQSPALDKLQQGRFVILYPTCNDFQPQCCESCVKQDYPLELFRVVICDDGSQDDYREKIDRFLKAFPETHQVRREERTGYKAGNLNHAFRQAINSDDQWILLVDADQMLPPYFLSQLARAVAEQPDKVAFVQGRNDAQHLAPPQFRSADIATTHFQHALGFEIRLFYENDLPLRQRYGFLPFLGHGGAIRRSAWLELGGFPTMVSEDYAFAMLVSAKGYCGAVAEDIYSWEAFPQDFGSFLVRMRKFAGGTAELFRKSFLNFLQSGASLTEKFDLCMLLAWYFLMPLVVLNGFLSALVCSKAHQTGFPVLHPVMPHLFLLMFLLSLPVARSATVSVVESVRFWFWATAIYTSILPIAAWRFLVHLFKDPTFDRTPKGAEKPPSFHGNAFANVFFGGVAMWFSWNYWSPFSPILMSQATAYVLFPTFRSLNENSWSGRLARSLVILPGLFLIWGLIAMWWWTRH